MTTVPGSLVWEIVKKQNAFLVKEFGNGNQMVQFSKESNNLYNLNSFKYSGLANKKTVTVQSAGKDLGVTFATTKTKKQNQPSKILHKAVMNKEFTKMAKAVANQMDVDRLKRMTGAVRTRGKGSVRRNKCAACYRQFNKRRSTL